MRNDGITVELADRALVVHGSCDATSAPRLATALRRMERRNDEFCVDLTCVTFADSTGVEPLVESIRRRRTAGRVDPGLRPMSSAVSRVFEILGIGTDPFDLIAWDAYDDPAHRTAVWSGRHR